MRQQLGQVPYIHMKYLISSLHHLIFGMRYYSLMCKLNTVVAIGNKIKYCLYSVALFCTA